MQRGKKGVNETESVYWERLNLYVDIREFTPDGCDSLLEGKTFNEKKDFMVFVVRMCIQNFGTLYPAMREYAMLKEVQPGILIRELYGLCININPLLSTGMEKVTNKENQRSGVQVMGREERREEQKEEKERKTFKDIKRSELLSLGDRIKTRVISQDEPVDLVVKAIQRAGAGIKDPEQPIGCFLLTGPTGVGKTYFAKILAEELMGSRSHLIRFDCSEFQSRHEYAKLVGAPHGYVGHDQGGLLTTAVKKIPFSVVLFDEVEKAHMSMHHTLLQIMDDAKLTDSRGFTVSFSDTIILLTSNLGVAEVRKITKTIGITPGAQDITESKRTAAIVNALKMKFRPEFINRLDEVGHFMPLSDPDACRSIVKLELDRLIDIFSTNVGVGVNYDNEIIDFLYREGFDVEYGARPLKRCIKEKFADPLASFFLERESFKDSFISSSLGEGEILFM